MAGGGRPASVSRVARRLMSLPRFRAALWVSALLFIAVVTVPAALLKFRIVSAQAASTNRRALGIVGGQPPKADFDGDGKTDLVFYRSTGDWYVLESSANFTTSFARNWGAINDIPVPGDYDGDRTADAAVFRPSYGSWYILESSTNFATSVTYQWGLAADIPVPGDYDGDGKTDLALYRPDVPHLSRDRVVGGHWYILESSTNFSTSAAYQWGVTGDIPVAGDYDGDGKNDVAVYRPSTGTWFILQSSTNFTTPVVYQWGVSTDIPVAADYDGDGTTDVAVYRPSTGTWYILESNTNFTSVAAYVWGTSTDIPLVSGDYDGDGKADLAILRPTKNAGDNFWYVLESSTNFTSSASYAWGDGTDRAVLVPPPQELPIHSCSEEGTIKESRSLTGISMIHFYNQSGSDRQLFELDPLGHRVRVPPLPFTFASNSVQWSSDTTPWLVADLNGVCTGIFMTNPEPSNVTIR